MKATSISEAVSALASHGDRAKLLAGGQSLIPMMNFRMIAPEVLIDIGDIADMAGLEVGDAEIRIGVATKHNAEYNTYKPPTTIKPPHKNSLNQAIFITESCAMTCLQSD